MRLVGWLCVIGIAGVIVELVTILPYMQDEWSARAAQPILGPGHFDLRMGIISPGPIGWLGMWGYLAAVVWMPLAAWRAFQAKRQGIPLGTSARILLALVPALFLVVQALLRFTPLGEEYPLV
jgi:hypothetical protein